MGDLFESWGGLTPSTSVAEYWNGKIPWVSSKDIKSPRISGGTEYVTEKALRAKCMRKCPPGSVLVVVRSGVLAHTLPVAINDEEVVINQDLKAFWSPSRTLNEWLALALRASAKEILSENRKDGTTVQSVRYEQLKDFELPVPPEGEQKRIVAKVEELLARVNAARERLARVPAILKRFRQSVLAAACSGRLTADWRESRSNIESALGLVDRIRAARKAALYGARAVVATRQRSREIAAEPPNPDFQEEFPENWVIASMDEITTRITSGSRDWKRYYRSDGRGTFIMAQNIRPMRFDRSYRLAVDPPSSDRDRTRSEVRQGDILVTIVGANTGDVCRLAEKLNEHYVCQSVALMRPALPEISPFVELYLNSRRHGQLQYQTWIYGEGRPHLSFDHLRATAIAVPPLEEQEEIVRRIGRLFELADVIEHRVAAGVYRADKLTHTILAKAFRGKLVPTEADLARADGRLYEPASVSKHG